MRKFRSDVTQGEILIAEKGQGYRQPIRLRGNGGAIASGKIAVMAERANALRIDSVVGFDPLISHADLGARQPPCAERDRAIDDAVHAESDQRAGAGIEKMISSLAMRFDRQPIADAMAPGSAAGHMRL